MMKCNFFYLILLILIEIILFGFFLKKIYEIVFCIITQLIIFAVIKDGHNHNILHNGNTVINYNNLNNDEQNNFNFCSICLEEEKEDLVKSYLP